MYKDKLLSVKRSTEPRPSMVFKEERWQRSGIDTINYHTWPKLPHGKVTKAQLNIKNKSKEVSPFQAGDNKAAMNRRESMKNTIQK